MGERGDASARRNSCLETRDLWFAYEDGRSALCGISLTIETGDFVAVIGQNGSGKTTLAKHFNGLLRPTSGQVLLHGDDVRRRSIGELARTVGYVFQNPDHQIFSATTREEIAFGPRNLGLGEDEVAQRTDQALAQFGLAHLADRQPALLGFGLRRKVSVAAVFAMRPQVLILDEPTSGLDRRSTQELLDQVLALHRAGHTILLITHDMRLVAEHAPKCLVLQDGRVLDFDETRAVFRQSDLMRQVSIDLPQISQLGKQLRAYGVRDLILTVDEFCDQYGSVLAARRSNDADRR